MAKAKEIAGLDCTANAADWAAEVLRVRFSEVVDLRGAALDFSDIEGVHNMRVATRRLRSALRDFSPLMKKRPLKRLKKDLKFAADALGAVRDEDVAIVALEDLQSAAETEIIKTGIENFLNERRERRETVRLDLIEAIAVSRVNGLQERFQIAVEKSLSRNKANSAMNFTEAGRKVVAESLQDLLDLGVSLYAPFDVKELHEMRIAAKRLRYAIELFVACWGERIVPFAEEIAEMQTALGEVHDCDVWIENLSERLKRREENPANETIDFQTAAWLLSEFIKKRTKEYRAALKIWSNWKANDFAERMLAAIN